MVFKKSKQVKSNGSTFFKPFTIIIIAAFYLAYRVALIAFPVLLLTDTISLPIGANEIVCNQDGSVQQPQTIVSEQYQSMINEQDALSPNLVSNSGIVDVSESGQPLGFTYSTKDASGIYQVVKTIDSGKIFLRVKNSIERNLATGSSAPAWLMNPVRVFNNKTYAFSFDYRSNTSVDVSMEYAKTNSDDLFYTNVATLEPTNSWSTFSAHFSNFDGATSIRVIPHINKIGQLDLRSFDVHEIGSSKLAGGIVSVVFEDGRKSVISNVMPLLTKYGIRTTQYVISDIAASETPEYMNFDDLKKMRRLGHEIGAQSSTHCSQTELDEQSVHDDAVNGKEILAQHGLGPIASFAYPLGQHNKTTQNFYVKQYQNILTSDIGYNDKYFDKTRIKTMAVLDSTSDSEIKSWLDYATKNGLWLVIVYHRVDESGQYNVSRNILDSQLRLILSSGLIVLPISEAAMIVEYDR